MDGEEGPRTGRYWPMFIGFPTIRSGAGELHRRRESRVASSDNYYFLFHSFPFLACWRSNTMLLICYPLSSSGIPGMNKHTLEKQHRCFEATRCDDRFDCLWGQHRHIPTE